MLYIGGLVGKDAEDDEPIDLTPDYSDPTAASLKRSLDAIQALHKRMNTQKKSKNAATAGSSSSEA